jgi:alkaline phosphatase D
MRIAFASCFCRDVFEDQPVWDWIRNKAPTHLVLLGDSIYLDRPGPLSKFAKKRIQEMSDVQFSEHLHSQYAAQIAQPQFRGLVASMRAGSVWSIWDDHDFLWNNALGAPCSVDPDQKNKVKLSTAYQEAFRQALSNSLAHGSFPTHAVDIAPSPEPLTMPSIELEPGTWLHLTDGRSHRTDASTILGTEQKAALQQKMKQATDAVHILASGSVLNDYKRKYKDDWRWLLTNAASCRTLVLSGDIHKNNRAQYTTYGYTLFEATSSGAALYNGITVGFKRKNFGLLDIEDHHIKVTLYAKGEPQPELDLTVNRDTWRAN